MATMRCPWCGSPATVRPNGQWECGWCGDFGNIALPTQQTQQTQQTRVNVLDTITKLAKAALPNWDAEVERLCGCVLFYELSLALTRGAALTAEARQTIDGLCQQTGNEFCSAKEMLRAAETKTPLFSAEAALSESECGIFWRRVIAALPPHQYSEPFPDAVADLLNCAEELYAYFFGKDSDDQRRDELWDGFQKHWIRYGVLHPDAAAAKDAIHRQDFSKYEHAYRDLLVATYPELIKELEPLPYNELNNLFEDDLLQRIYPKNPALALSMWRLLLDTAAEHLSEPEVAERLLQDDMETVWNSEDCAPILDALEADDSFAKQLFQEAAPCEAQSSLLQLCIKKNRKSLYQKLQVLAGESAAPTEALGILMKKFPQIMTDCPLETFQDMDERDILTYYYPIDPVLAIQMWRCLLDADGVNLHDPQTANRLIRLAMASIWDNRTDLTPLLDELERDPCFAKQLMQCAYVGVPQKYIFRACVSAGKMELLDSLQMRLKNSSYPQSKWYRSWDDLQATIEKRRGQMAKSVEKSVTPVPADGQTYRYCQVRFPKVPRAYSYLTEDDSIRAGDWVLAPFGRENADWTGQVEKVTVCTAATAPYPPERTKHIISKTDAPPEPTPAPQTEKKPVPPVAKSPAEEVPEPEKPKATEVVLTATAQKAAPVQAAARATPPTAPKHSFLLPASARLASS